MYQFKVKLEGEQRFRSVMLNRLPRSCGCDGTLEEWLEEAVLQQEGCTDYNTKPQKVKSFRAVPDVSEIGVVTLYVIRNYREYGGPEEGGWYYNSPDLLRTFRVREDRAPRLRTLLSRYQARANEGRSSWDRDGEVQVTAYFTPMRERPHYC